MENINLLLEKYFQAGTTLAEEKILKNYFSGNEVLPEHEQFMYLFATFKQELMDVNPSEIKVQQTNRQKVNKYIIQAMISTGIAACLLIGLWIIQPKNEVENYAVVNGEMNMDSDFAQKYVEEKLNEVNTVVEKNMKPIQILNVVKKRLQPMQNLKTENAKSDKQTETTNPTKTPIK